MGQRPTTVTILTPSGRGAVGTVSVEGPQAVDLVEQCFTAASGNRLMDIPLRRLVFGRWLPADDRGEELVVSRLADEHIEVHCHGGTAAAELVLSTLENLGARRLSPGDWLRTGEPDVIAAEARAALAHAKTERTALILLDQYHGALRREVEAVIDCLASGDDLTGERRLSRLSQLGKAGLHLTTPWRVAIVGPPNVGKSSLMNALVGYSRSIVFDQPGTTRDLVRAETAFDGWPLELIDTAGLRETEDAIESAGVERAEQAMTSADLCLRISDSLEFTDMRDDCDVIIHADIAELAVFNKIDLLPEPTAFIWPGPKVSAKTGRGLPELMQSIVQSLLGVAPLPGEAVPFTPRQIALVDLARQSALEHGADLAIVFLRQITADDQHRTS